MTLPESVQVGPYRISIEGSHKDANQTDSDGCISLAYQEIRIRPDMHPDYAAMTLLHETLHAIWRTTNLRTLHDVDLEEQVVDALAPLLLDTLRRNPELTAYLMGESE